MVATGIGLTITVTLAVAVQIEFDTVTVYNVVTVGVTFIVAVEAPVLH
jgi:hypothetical protein